MAKNSNFFLQVTWLRIWSGQVSDL